MVRIPFSAVDFGTLENELKGWFDPFSLWALGFGELLGMVSDPFLSLKIRFNFLEKKMN
jgi:hypothetical protein